MDKDYKFRLNSGEELNLRNLRIAPSSRHSSATKRLVNFFDIDGNGWIKSSYPKKDDEIFQFFKSIKKYIKDGEFSDEDIADFLSKNEEISDITVEQFKCFLTGVEPTDIVERSSSQIEENVNLPVSVATGHSYNAPYEEEQRVFDQTITTETQVFRDNASIQTEKVSLDCSLYADRSVLTSEKVTRYDENGLPLQIVEHKYDSFQLRNRRNNFNEIRQLIPKEIITTYENDQVATVVEKTYPKLEFYSTFDNDQIQGIATEPILTIERFYENGQITRIERTEIVDGKTVFEEIFYEDGQISSSIKYVDGVKESESNFQRITVEIQNPESLDENDTISVDLLTTIEVVHENGQITNIEASEIDECGHFTDEAFIKREIIDGNRITTLEKYPINGISDSLNEQGETVQTTTLLGYQLVETVEDENFQSVTCYNSDSLTEYDSEGAYMIYQEVLQDGQIFSCEYDGEGNTVVYLQNGECESVIVNDFCPLTGMTEERFLNHFYEINGFNYPFIVGERACIPTEISPDAEVLTGRLSREESIALYEEWFSHHIYEVVNTAQWEIYTLNQDFDNVYDLAEHILKERGEYRRFFEPPTADDINNFAWELMTLHGGVFRTEELKSGANIHISTDRICEEHRDILDSLGISVDNYNNHIFFIHFNNLKNLKGGRRNQEAVLNTIRNYRETNNIQGDFTEEQFEDLKRVILQTNGFSLTDSGLYVENQADIYSEFLTSEQRARCDGKKFTLEDFITELGLNLDEGSEGAKLYRRFSFLQQDYLNQMPFSLIMQEIENYRASGGVITCDYVTDLIEEITMFGMSIRFDENGVFLEDEYNARLREIQTDVPEIVAQILTTQFEAVLNAVKQELNSLKPGIGGQFCNWFAERIEACGGDTDNAKDVEQALKREQYLINQLRSNPTVAFKALTGLDFTFENVRKVLNGDFELPSLDALRDYCENLEDYEVWFKAIVMTIISIAVTVLCPVSALGASAAWAGRVGNFFLNTARVSTIAGTCSVAYGYIDSKVAGREYSWGDAAADFGQGFITTGVMCTSNAAGALFMRLGSKIPGLGQVIKISSGIEFKTLAFGNIYEGAFALRALCYASESGFQTMATLGQLGQFDAITDPYSYVTSLAAGGMAIKLPKLFKRDLTSRMNGISNRFNDLLPQIDNLGLTDLNTQLTAFKNITADVSQRAANYNTAYTNMAVAINAGHQVTDDMLNSFRVAKQEFESSIGEFNRSKDALLSATQRAGSGAEEIVTAINRDVNIANNTLISTTRQFDNAFIGMQNYLLLKEGNNIDDVLSMSTIQSSGTPRNVSLDEMSDSELGAQLSQNQARPVQRLQLVTGLVCARATNGMKLLVKANFDHVGDTCYSSKIYTQLGDDSSETYTVEELLADAEAYGFEVLFIGTDIEAEDYIRLYSEENNLNTEEILNVYHEIIQVNTPGSELAPPGITTG